MKTIIKNKIKSITCKHQFERFAYFYSNGLEIQRCAKCNKRKEIK